ncbi:MAG TPA: polyprenol monophosphomannose synthase [Vicinamibacterales bacterium]|nr:polyprenol monophosphomannose synthase [Vicinamibacterales bacterium]HOG29872.1 polyprenol monophosphomannose synthase [Vicinamibacterales bacterium]HOQ59783.1 polyprenol monophosphomannose synthase [Vicinamibacterales bacterium]HPK71362.1 polyprenol monophosphomannose synthase [Vicinamibacterales bacterium]HPW20178.1 polyprenol monophosphomannose synthase [Vicinamibacterales bacterium]
MPDGPLVSVVVPTYNERERLGRFVELLAGVLGEARLDGEIVIVDDNSPDGTGALADTLAARHPVRVIHRSGKLGLGTAVMAGFAAARGEILGVMDADISHPPERLPVLVAALRQSGADVVIGSRYIPGGGTRNWPASRAVMSRAACLAARALTPVRDAASGFFVLRRPVIAGVEIKAAGFKICLELLVRGQVGSVLEVPYLFSDRAAGQSKMNHREALGYLVQLAQLFMWRLSRGAPRPAWRRLSPEEADRLAARA